MKNRVVSVVIITGMVMILSFHSTQAQQGSVSYAQFYNELQPYGTWANNPQYGSVWIPNVAPGFTPYSTNGYWALTDYGNTWVSDYAWGWAPFHYGRWMFDDYAGWMWVPGYEWAPAWVAWRSGAGYYGWAPLAPFMNISVNINIPNRHWIFVPQQHLCGVGGARYDSHPSHGVTIINQTTIINNVYNENHNRYFTGPSQHDMEHRAGHRIERYSVTRSDAPRRTVVHDRSVNIYQPNYNDRSHDDHSVSTQRDARSFNQPEQNQGRDTRDEHIRNDFNQRDHQIHVNDQQTTNHVFNNREINNENRTERRSEFNQPQHQPTVINRPAENTFHREQNTQHENRNVQQFQRQQPAQQRVQNPERQNDNSVDTHALPQQRESSGRGGRGR